MSKLHDLLSQLFAKGYDGKTEPVGTTLADEMLKPREVPRHPRPCRELRFALPHGWREHLAISAAWGYEQRTSY